MVEMKRTGPGEAQLLEGGAVVGQANWRMEPLAWPGEEVQVAQVETLQAPAELRSDFWAYLCFLFQRDRAAAARLDGVLFWFSQALQKSYETQG